MVECEPHLSGFLVNSEVQDMGKATNGSTIASHFENKDVTVKLIYDQLLNKLRGFGSICEEPKKTSIHLVNTTAFAGVATRMNSIIMTIKSDRRLSSARIHKTQQTSARRFHHEVRLTSPADIDAELLAWLRNAYELSA
jgi:Domain of unknown function (DUF5655)